MEVTENQPPANWRVGAKADFHKSVFSEWSQYIQENSGLIIYFGLENK